MSVNKPDSIAKIRLTDAFVITGRGLGIIAEILEGALSTNDWLQFHLPGKTYRLSIRSIEEVYQKDDQGNALPLIGLMVRATEQETSELRHHPQIRDVIADIYSKTKS